MYGFFLLKVYPYIYSMQIRGKSVAAYSRYRARYKVARSFFIIARNRRGGEVG